LNSWPCLIASLEDEAVDDVEALWVHEANRRLKEAEDGVVLGPPRW
jgi:hypothetical protein